VQVGLDFVTSANCKSRLWFGLDKQLSTLVLKFNFIFSISLVLNDEIMDVFEILPHRRKPLAARLDKHDNNLVNGQEKNKIL
jgi:hypothetical protein